MNELRRANGYALVTVLWLITLLTILTMSYHASARLESRMIAQTIRRAQAEASAEAGLWITLHETARKPQGFPSGKPPTTLQVSFLNEPVTVTLGDTAGRVNINRAEHALILSVLETSDLAPSDRLALTDAILDWRDLDTEKRSVGAEDADYRRVGLDHGARDALFATTDELRQVIGMTDAVYRVIRPLVTVYGDHIRVNAHAAPREVLFVLPGATASTVETFITARRQPDPSGPTLVSDFDRRFLQGRGGDVYVATATASIGGFTARLSAIIRQPARRSEPLHVLAFESSGIPL